LSGVPVDGNHDANERHRSARRRCGLTLRTVAAIVDACQTPLAAGRMLGLC
jgi:hypothetical protein